MSTLFATEELVGEVLGLVYVDATTGFGVAELDSDDHPEPARAAGPLSDLVSGQLVRLVGSWRDHPRFGPTFEATLYEQVVPTTAAGVAGFLASERFADVPEPARAAVVEHFGDDAGRVLQHEPERLVEAGIEPEQATALAESWAAGRALAELTRLLTPAGFGPAGVRAAHARFGTAAGRLAREDPYRLLDVDRVGFGQVDRLARELGIEAGDQRRLAAGARAAAGAARDREGHQLVPVRRVVADAARLLRVDAAAAQAGLEHAVAQGVLVRDRVTPRGADEPVDVVASGPGLRSERRLAREVARLLGDPGRLSPRLDQVEPSDELTAGQADAVRRVFAGPVTLLTGGPGTGKTRAIEEVVLAAEELGASVALCAPTGRAAKRIEELVGRPASTVHRLLEARPTEDGGFVFTYGRDQRLPFDLVVCDEVSMCDTALALALVAAVDTGAHLLLVGDPDQLPSVGPGDVLRDLLASGAVPTCTLTEVHRQAARSRIVALAREIDAGTVGELRPVDGDVFLAEEPRRAAIVPRVVAAVAENAPRHLGVAVDDVQVVAPVYRGPVGVDALNAALRERLNPPGGRPDVGGFHEGDRVMQTRNDADLDVANGDVGTVVDVDAGRARMRVLYPRGEVTYGPREARDLTLAWAVTVHKAQGGEWPVVVLVCDRSHGSMLGRNLLYTAVTRAREALVVVGQSDQLRLAATRDADQQRVTGLVDRLRRALASADGAETREDTGAVEGDHNGDGGADGTAA